MARRYYMLVTSLPRLPHPFGAERTPISRLQLDRRLALLDPADRELLARVERLLGWEHHPMGRADEALADQAARLVPHLPGGALRRMVGGRLELATVLAALRRRRRGERAPAPGERWGYGPWQEPIRRHWEAPAFGLERRLPWIGEVHELLEAGEPRALERALVGIEWSALGRAAEGHYFDLEAVVAYVLRWRLVERWTRAGGAAAAERFARMTEAGLGEHAGAAP